MRILLVNDYGTASGGAERQMIDLRAGLRARGHQVRLFTSNAVQVPGWPIEADATCFGTVRQGRQFLESANPFAMRALSSELRDHPPEIVHIRMFLTQLSPAILPLLQDVPTLYQAAFYKAICPTGLRILPDGSPCRYRAGRACLANRCVRLPTWVSAMAAQRMLRRNWSSIDCRMALSAEMAAMLEHEGLGRFGVMPNGVEERTMRPPLSGSPLFAFAGRLSREKGVDVLIEAFAAVRAQLPDARLVIAGDGPLREVLRRRADALHVRASVDFIGYVQRGVMERAFDRAWAQIVPSTWQEPFGNVATEAMMRGTAVIASDVGGLGDIVAAGKTGLLVPAGDVRALGDAMIAIGNDRALASRLGEAGRDRAMTEFGRAAVLDRLESLYRDIISATGR